MREKIKQLRATINDLRGSPLPKKVAIAQRGMEEIYEILAELVDVIYPTEGDNDDEQ